MRGGPRNMNADLKARGVYKLTATDRMHAGLTEYYEQQGIELGTPARIVIRPIAHKWAAQSDKSERLRELAERGVIEIVEQARPAGPEGCGKPGVLRLIEPFDWSRLVPQPPEPEVPEECNSVQDSDEEPIQEPVDLQPDCKPAQEPFEPMPVPPEVMDRLREEIRQWDEERSATTTASTYSTVVFGSASSGATLPYPTPTNERLVDQAESLIVESFERMLSKMRGYDGLKSKADRLEERLRQATEEIVNLSNLISELKQENKRLLDDARFYESEAMNVEERVNREQDKTLAVTTVLAQDVLPLLESFLANRKEQKVYADSVRSVLSLVGINDELVIRVRERAEAALRTARH